MNPYKLTLRMFLKRGHFEKMKNSWVYQKMLGVQSNSPKVTINDERNHTLKEVA